MFVEDLNYWERKEELKKKRRKYRRLTVLIWGSMYAEFIALQIKYSDWLKYLIDTVGNDYVRNLIVVNLFYMLMMILPACARYFYVGDEDSAAAPGEISWILDFILLLIHTWFCFKYFPKIAMAAGIL